MRKPSQKTIWFRIIMSFVSFMALVFAGILLYSASSIPFIQYWGIGTIFIGFIQMYLAIELHVEEIFNDFDRRGIKY